MTSWRTGFASESLRVLAGSLLACASACNDDTAGDGGADASTSEGSSSETSVDATMPDTGEDPSTGPAVDTSSTETSSSSETGSSSEDASSSETSAPTLPQAHDDAYDTPQDAPLGIAPNEGLLANDTGGALTVASFDAESIAGGTVIIEPDGQLAYVPPAGHWGPDTFGYTIEDENGETSSAQVTIFVTPVTVPLVEVSEGTGGFLVTVEQIGDSAGVAVTLVPDANGDGLDDALIVAAGATGGAEFSGRAYLVFGKVDTDAVALGQITAGNGGFAIDGENEFDVLNAAAPAGDVDGDGLGDVLIGAANADPNGDASGRAYLVFGKADDTEVVALTDVSAGVGGFAMNGEAAEDYTGISVAGVGDVDGDAIPDLLVQASQADANGTDSGRSYVVFGKADTDPVELADIAAGIGGFAIDGESAGDSAPVVSNAGDVNGDGAADLLVGAWFREGPLGFGQGRSYVVFGKADTQTVALADIADGDGGFIIDGAGQGDAAGQVSAAGDVDGDGLDDILVGAPDYEEVGGVYVVFGKADTTAVDLADVGAGDGGYVIVAESVEEALSTPRGVGDVNGDGRPDLLVAAPFASGYAGRGYVVYGKDDTLPIMLAHVTMGIGGFAIEGTVPEAYLGYVGGGGGGDVNGDGFADVIIGNDPGSLTDGTDAAYVVFGVPTGP